MKKSIISIFVIIILLVVAYEIYIKSNTMDTKQNITSPLSEIKKEETKTPEPSVPVQPEKRNFTDEFASDSALNEAGSIVESKSPSWWVNSGAYLNIKDGMASTVSGNLEANNKWRLLYNKNNPGETDKGFHPQNIFRLVLKSKWQNFEQQAYFQITADNLSADSHRTGSNGLLLFNRYLDGNNLYYTGIRVDGTAIIKKKIKGTYFTMAQKSIIPGNYNRDTNPNLLPKNKWIGLKSIVKDNPDGTVDIELYTDLGNTGNWTLASKTIDDNKTYGGKTILDPGYAGIRTDFMNVEFDNYKIIER